MRAACRDTDGWDRDGIQATASVWAVSAGGRERKTWCWERRRVAVFVEALKVEEACRREGVEEERGRRKR